MNKLKNKINVAWWSAGITSAIASKIAINSYSDVELYYIETGTAHPDNARFKSDCENWYGKEIHTIRSKKFKNVDEVINYRRYINGVAGAPCTYELKKKVRFDLEETFNVQHQIFGFEFSKHEINRALRFKEQYPATNPLFPLIQKKLTKNNCAAILKAANIELPTMYKLGYKNNNCIGCVKGGKGYWNQIRKDFPERFNEMSLLERKYKHSCIKNTFLDELPAYAGNMSKEIFPACDMFCELELLDVLHPDVNNILNGD